MTTKRTGPESSISGHRTAESLRPTNNSHLQSTERPGFQSHKTPSSLPPKTVPLINLQILPHMFKGRRLAAESNRAPSQIMFSFFYKIFLTAHGSFSTRAHNYSIIALHCYMKAIVQTFKYDRPQGSLERAQPFLLFDVYQALTYWTIIIATY